MRIRKSDTTKRIVIKLNKSITSDKIKGVMTYGENNDYPQVIERIVHGSITAKSTRKIYSKFLIGGGFEDTNLNNKVVAKDSRGKDITMLSLLRNVSDSIAMYNGVYLHVNMNLVGNISSVKNIPFKNCRFSKLDENNYSPKIGVYENWEKDSDKKFEQVKIRWYNVFNNNPQVIASQVKDAGSFKKFKGQIYFMFLDNEFTYPLSPFDPVYLDCDTEQQVALFKNNMTRNGMTDKIILRMQEPSNEDDKRDLDREVESWQGTEGDNLLILFDEIDPNTGEIKTNGAFKVDKIESNIKDKMFEGWQSELSNNIRKSVNALPAILIDYDESKLGTTSGESIIQATKFYNAMTQDDRVSISGMFKEIFKNFNDEYIKRNENWNIIPLNLYESTTDI